MKGVVYLDELDRQMVVLRKDLQVVSLAESGLAWSERFTFYDQVHTTGMDIKQTVDACAMLTLGKDMVFRDYAQGAFRMRGIGKGQTIKLLVVPEILERVRIQVERLAIRDHIFLFVFMQVAVGRGNAVSDDVPPTKNASEAPADLKQFLEDVIAWLVINSMRVDGVQFNLLCEQNVANIWRKTAFAGFLAHTSEVDLANTTTSKEIGKSLTVFRERIDFQIENTVPAPEKYSTKIAKMIEAHRYCLWHQHIASSTYP